LEPTGRRLVARVGPACGLELIPPLFFAPALNCSAGRVVIFGFVPPALLVVLSMPLAYEVNARPASSWLNAATAGPFRSAKASSKPQGIISEGVGL
jgi:hypothetical protein